MKEQMFAKCILPDGAMMSLDAGKEYKILRVTRFEGFGDVFFLLSDGVWYASCHFSVTYMKPTYE